MAYAVIMAGGSGTRLWPASRTDKPKQFFSIDGKKSMLRHTAERISVLTGEENLLIVTGSKFVADTLNHIPFISRDQVIAEPAAKNTAPCIAAAAAKLLDADPDAVMIVLPADHHIEDADSFRNTIQQAVKAAQENDSLITIGIKPAYPETGYGYIETEAESTGGSGTRYPVKSFTEKPDPETAADFLVSGRYLWNSGMFVWKASAIMNAFKEYQPEIYEQARNLADSGFNESSLISYYSACPSVSIDYGILERAGNIEVIPADFGWSDIGSWKSVFNLKTSGGKKNVAMANNVIFEDSQSNLAYSKSNNKLIVFSGVENICLVETEDAILVLNMDHAQEVKPIVEKLKKDDDNSPYL